MMLLQAINFVALARVLGANDYGRIASVNALITITVAFGDLGFGYLVTMRCSVYPDRASRELSSSILVNFVSGTLVMAALVAFSLLYYGPHAEIRLLVILGISELIFIRCAWVCSQFHAGLDEFGVASTLLIAIGVCRLVAIAWLVVRGNRDIFEWASALLVLSGALCAVAVANARRRCARFDFSIRRAAASVPEAIHFALGTVARAANTDLDKVFLSKFRSSVELGSYTSAYRIIALAFVPVRSLMQAGVTRVFRAGAKGLHDAVGVTHRLLRVSFPYAALAGVAIYFGAPLAVWFLGPTFASSIPMLRALSIVPAIQSVQYAYSDALTGAGYQRLRTNLQFAVVAAYALIGMSVIRRYGWIGAAWTCIVSETVLGVLMYVCVRLLTRKTSVSTTP